MSNAVTTPAQPPKHRRPWRRTALLFLAIVILAPVAILSYSHMRMQHDWNEAEVEADRLDPRWRLQDILDEQIVIPEKENSAKRIVAVQAKAPNSSIMQLPLYRVLMIETLPACVQLNAQQLELLRSQASKHKKAIEEARLLEAFPNGRFSLKLDDGFISPAFPNDQDGREVCELLMHDAYLGAHEGNSEQALQSCRAILNVGRAYRDDPLLLSLLVRGSIQSRLTLTLQRVLAQGEIKDAELKRMQDLLEPEIRDTTMSLGIRGQRAGTHCYFDNVRAGKIEAISVRTLAAMVGDKGTNSLEEFASDYLPSTIMKYYPEYAALK